MQFDQKLTRYPQRPEQEVIDPEVWQPNWNCFCCHDTGIVLDYLVKLIIDDYDVFLDKFPRCSKPGCESGSHFDSDALAASVDERLSPTTCKQLDEYQREQERKAMFDHAANLRQRVYDLAKAKSVRVGDRTENEEREVQLRKEEVDSF